MGRSSLVGATSSVSRARPSKSFVPVALLVLLLLLSWPDAARAMRPARIAQLRKETVDMFYHGYDNYMRIAFPEDEVCLKPTTTLRRLASFGHLLITSI